MKVNITDFDLTVFIRDSTHYLISFL